MKHLIIILVIVAVVGVGAWWYVSQAPNTDLPATSTTENNSAQKSVESSSGMADIDATLNDADVSASSSTSFGDVDGDINQL